MKKLSKIFAVVLTLAMVLSILPMGAAAADTVDCTKITSLDQLVDGQYAIVGVKGNDSYAFGAFDGSSWITVVNPTISGTTATVAANAVWTIDYDAAAGTITLKDSTGAFVKPKSGNTNGIASGTYNWKITCTNGQFFIAGTGSDTTRLAFNASSDYKVRSYKTGTLDGTNGSGYIDELLLFKANSAVQDTRENLPTASGAIVDAIFALQSGETLSKYYKYEGDITLTGIVAGNATWSDSYNNGTVNFKVKDSSNADKTMQAYKLVPGTGLTADDVKNLTTGDTVTIKGSVIKNFNGTFEFDGSTLVSVTKGQVQLPALPTEKDDIVDAIFDLAAGETLDMYYDYEDFTLSGTIVGETSWSDQHSNGELTIKIDGTEKELLAYRFTAGEIDVDTVKALAAGDKVTFKVESVKNYNGTHEMEYPVLTAVEKATPKDPDKVGDDTAVVAMTTMMVVAVAALAVLVINKKRMF